MHCSFKKNALMDITLVQVQVLLNPFNTTIYSITVAMILQKQFYIFCLLFYLSM